MVGPILLCFQQSTALVSWSSSLIAAIFYWTSWNLILHMGCREPLMKSSLPPSSAQFLPSWYPVLQIPGTTAILNSMCTLQLIRTSIFPWIPLLYSLVGVPKENAGKMWSSLVFPFSWGSQSYYVYCQMPKSVTSDMYSYFQWEDTSSTSHSVWPEVGIFLYMFWCIVCTLIKYENKKKNPFSFLFEDLCFICLSVLFLMICMDSFFF